MELQKMGFSAYRRELSHWQQARALRYDATQPLTYALQEVYTDTLLDAHLSASINNRLLRLQNKRYVVRDAQGNTQAPQTQWLQRPWFRDLISSVASSIFYGYSLIWLKGVEKNRKEVNFVPVDRRHVIPEHSCVLGDMRQMNSAAVRYDKWREELVYAQLGDSSIGLLEKAVPLTILKRHSWANWDEFEQVFGLPIRIARVPNLQSGDTQRIARWLEEMGTAAYAVLPDTAQLEIKQSRRSDAHQVFKEKILAVNAELSKLINGQTMTIDSGSSRSQSEVHLITEKALTQADLHKLISWLNNELLPFMHRHVKEFHTDDKIEIIEQPSQEERLLVDKELLRAGVSLSASYIEETYGVKLDSSEKS